MGYTHYWYREPEISVETMHIIVEDVSRLILVLDDNGVPLAGPIGDGMPEITAEWSAFNGSTSRRAKRAGGELPRHGGAFVFLAKPRQV